MKSWLLSSLRFQHLAKGRDQFLTVFKNPWLLWEPGSWAPPQRRTMHLPVRTVVNTRVDPSAPAPAATAEALAIALVGDQPLVLGRDEGCDLVINDATLSSKHLSFHPGPTGWSVEDLGSTNGSRVLQVALKSGDRVALHDGAALEAGRVSLTFCASEGLWARLTAR